MHFTDIFIERPVLAIVVSLFILLIGVRSLDQLNVRQYPESKSAIITVVTPYVGASAEVIEGFITTPLETEIASADGIDYMESSSIQGVSVITVHLRLNYDPNAALTQIITNINKVRNQLPAESESPVVDITIGERIDSMYLGFFSDVLQPNQITDYLTRVVKPKLEAVEGIQQAEILGGRVFAMRIWLKPDKMAALHITPAQVRERLAANNFLAAVGSTHGEMISVNLTAATDLHTAEEFKNLVVKDSPDTIIRLGDIANVVLGAENYDSSVRFNGKFATFIGIKVLPTANPLTVIQDVRKLFPEIKAQFPEGLDASIPYDATVYIQDSIHEVITTLVEALGIVVIVIFLFLGAFRFVLIPVVAIPLSMIGAGFIMLMLGYTINLLTLLAMVLAIGLVVDDAIIVVENIQRHIEDGLAPLSAAIQGARELATPIIAMTITLVAVYAPIALRGGLTGTLFTEFAFTLAGAVVISGVIALTLSPMMCAHLLKADTGREGFAHFLERQFETIRTVYQRMLHHALEMRPVIYVFVIIVLASCYFLFVTSKTELAPTEDQGIILIQAGAAPDAAIEQTMMYTEQLNGILSGFPETANVFLINGGGGGGSAATKNFAFAGMVFKPWSDRDHTQMEVMPSVQHKINEIAGLQTVAFPRPSLPGAGSGLPVQFVIGSTEEALQVYRVAQELVGRAMQSGLFSFANTDLKYDLPQVTVEVDRLKAANLGISMQDLGEDLATMLGGNYVNWFSIEGRSYKVIPQVERKYRVLAEQLGNYYINTRSNELVPASTVVSLKQTVEPEQLKRFQQLNSATVSAVLNPGVTMGDGLDFLDRTAAEIFPKGFTADYAGESRQYKQEGTALLVTFFFSLIVIYLVLAAQFESFRDPLIMLVSVPMSICGALIFISLGFATVNIYTQVGLITLIGLISKHGILIVQFANQRQREGEGKRQAVEEAASVRLRPILMTTAAMVLGVVPLLLATGAGAVSRFDIGLVVFTGLTIGTAFTLFVVPAIYMLLAKEHREVQTAIRA